MRQPLPIITRIDSAITQCRMRRDSGCRCSSRTGVMTIVSRPAVGQQRRGLRACEERDESSGFGRRASRVTEAA